MHDAKHNCVDKMAIHVPNLCTEILPVRVKKEKNERMPKILILVERSHERMSCRCIDIR